MPTFEEFDDKFRAARGRVSSHRHHNKTNGKKPSGVDAESEKFVSPDATIGVSLEDFHAYMPMHS
jgi:hypothetical protein